MLRFKKFTRMLALSAALMLAAVSPAYAADVSPDENTAAAETEADNPAENPDTSEAEETMTVRERNGSIRIRLEDGAEGTEKEGVVFGYTLVAELKNGRYNTVERYAGAGDLNELETAQQMEELAAKLQDMTETPDGTVITDAAGEALIRDLKTGVYLVDIREAAEYETVTPFLVAVPTWDETEHFMKYEVEVFPKHEPLPKEEPEKPQQPPQMPERPSAPQTGLESHQKELAAGAAVCVLCAGILAAAGRKKKHNI